VVFKGLRLIDGQAGLHKQQSWLLAKYFEGEGVDGVFLLLLNVKEESEV
jgi:hypothetical protein